MTVQACLLNTSHALEVFSVAWSPDNQYLASGSRDKKVRLWDAQTGRVHQTLSGRAGRVQSVAWSPDGRYPASGCDGIDIWDVTTARHRTRLRGR